MQHEELGFSQSNMLEASVNSWREFPCFPWISDDISVGKWEIDRKLVGNTRSRNNCIHSGMKTEGLDYMATLPPSSDCGPISAFDFSDNWFRNLPDSSMAFVFHFCLVTLLWGWILKLLSAGPGFKSHHHYKVIVFKGHLRLSPGPAPPPVSPTLWVDVAMSHPHCSIWILLWPGLVLTRLWAVVGDSSCVEEGVFPLWVTLESLTHTGNLS